MPAAFPPLPFSSVNETPLHVLVCEQKPVTPRGSLQGHSHALFVGASHFFVLGLKSGPQGHGASALGTHAKSAVFGFAQLSPFAAASGSPALIAPCIAVCAFV